MYHPSICPSIYVSVRLSIHQTIYQSIFLTNFLSVCVSICLFFRLIFYPSLLIFVYHSSLYSSIYQSNYLYFFFIFKAVWKGGKWEFIIVLRNRSWLLVSFLAEAASEKMKLVFRLNMYVEGQGSGSRDRGFMLRYETEYFLFF